MLRGSELCSPLFEGKLKADANKKHMLLFLMLYLEMIHVSSLGSVPIHERHLHKGTSNMINIMDSLGVVLLAQYVSTLPCRCMGEPFLQYTTIIQKLFVIAAAWLVLPCFF